jgi:hypothetical protein
MYHADLAFSLMEFFLKSNKDQEYTVNEIYNELYCLPGTKDVQRSAKNRIRSHLKVMHSRGYISIRIELTKKKTFQFKIKTNDKIREIKE